MSDKSPQNTGHFFSRKESIFVAVVIFVMECLDLETLVMPKMDIQVSFCKLQ